MSPCLSPTPVERVPWRVGDRCEHVNYGLGTVEYVGKMEDGSDSIFVGIDLDNPRAAGHDGAIFGVRYFRCAPKHGVMTPKWRTQLHPTPLLLVEEAQVELQAEV